MIEPSLALYHQYYYLSRNQQMLSGSFSTTTRILNLGSSLGFSPQDQEHHHDYRVT